MKNLSPKEELFCREYLVGYNPLNAYVRAGFKSSDASEAKAKELLKSDKIQNRLSEMRADVAVKHAATGNQVIAELNKIAFARISANSLVSVRDKLSALETLATICGLKHDFNYALSTLRNYGITLYQDDDGKWCVYQDA